MGLKEGCIKSGGRWSGSFCEIESISSGGQRLVNLIFDNHISSYRKEPVTFVATTVTAKEFLEGKALEKARERIESGQGIPAKGTEILEKYFNKTPVMRIDKFDNDKFHVDFEAGFQRGWFTATRESLCKALPPDLPNIHTRKPWIKWIGLDCDMPVIKEWLKIKSD